MNEKVKVYATLAATSSRLHELGVHENVLRDAVEFGTAYAAECTLHDPPNLAGILAWGKMIRALRDRLIPSGWKPSNVQNYATVVNPSRDFAITVAAGDAFTGLADKTPTTRSEKGPATRDAVLQNQLSFTDIDASFPRPLTATLKQTWLLLHYADKEKEEVRAELSLPAEMTSEGYVTAWKERIILSPMPYVKMPVSNTDSTTDAGDEEIEVKVERRA